MGWVVGSVIHHCKHSRRNNLHPETTKLTLPLNTTSTHPLPPPTLSRHRATCLLPSTASWQNYYYQIIVVLWPMFAMASAIFSGGGGGGGGGGDADAQEAAPSASFAVNNVNRVTGALPKRKPDQWFAPAPGRSAKAQPTPKLVCPDACSRHPGLLDSQRHTHGFIAAITTAFDEHRPLVLRPQHFWTLVLQAVAKHVNSNVSFFGAHFNPCVPPSF